MEELEGLGVKAIINLCDEYKGPTRTYRRNGVSLLWLMVEAVALSVKHSNQLQLKLSDI